MQTSELVAQAAAAGFPHYAEYRAQTITSRRAGYVDGKLTSNSMTTSAGFSARVLRRGLAGFSAGTVSEPGDVRRIIDRAAANADFLARREAENGVDIPAGAPGTFEDGLDLKVDVPQKDLTDKTGDWADYIARTYPDLSSASVSTLLLNIEKHMHNSDGAVIHSYVPRSLLVAQFTIGADRGDPVSCYEIFGGYGNAYTALPDDDTVRAKLETLYGHLRRKAEGVYASAGTKTVILASDITGILAHEAVGHTVEADLVRAGSVAATRLNTRVASENITLVDYAREAFGAVCPVPVTVDDEGTIARDVTLIEDGILKNFMHNKRSAAEMGFEPAGNGRAYDYFDEPLIRMRNTCILPGNDSLDDMIAATDDGYLLLATGNGQADATGEFMFGITLGYEIKNGRLGRAIRDTTISGLAFDVLQTVDMVSDEFFWMNGGFCGKKQMITVGMGGPAVRLRINVGGRG